MKAFLKTLLYVIVPVVVLFIDMAVWSVLGSAVSASSTVSVFVGVVGMGALIVSNIIFVKMLIDKLERKPDA